MAKDYKGPSKNAYLQQKSRMRQLVYTTPCVTGALLIIGILFSITGAIALTYAYRITQFQYVYMDATNNTACADGSPSTSPCLLTLNITDDIPGPAYFYYTLDGFHQNHRRFVKDKDDAQLAGLFEAQDTATQDPVLSQTLTSTFNSHADCSFQNSYVVKPAGGRPEGYTVYYYPCGLVARSKFNDTFLLRDGNNNVVSWTSQGVAWRSNADKKYMSKDEAWLRNNCYKLGGPNFDTSGFGESLRGFQGTMDATKSRYDCWQNVEDENFNVWMRAATGYSFWKLHKIIDGDLKAGTYTLEIGSNFPVAAFGGKKGFVLSNATPFGGNSLALGMSYLFVGVLFVLLALFFAGMAQIRTEGSKPEIRYPDVVVKMRASREQRTMCAGLIPETLLLRGNKADHDGEEAKRNVVVPSATGPDAEKFVTNFVSTTKYTALSFIPMNLFLQFHRFSNCYFLVIAILASIPSISPVGGLTFWFPLMLVICLTALKDGMEDYRRYQSDVEENNRQTEVLNTNTGEFEQVPWKEVLVGSIVRITTAEDGCSAMIPADLCLIATSSEDGTCFLETANLDGETNLKLRHAPEALHRELTTVSVSSFDGARIASPVMAKIHKLVVTVVCSLPDALLYDFNARMVFDAQDIPLTGGSSGGQFLQRSTKLRNTRWCIGLVVYTGKETKIQKNMSEPPNKVSAIERRLNTFILCIFVFQALLCIAGAIGASIWIALDTTKAAWYLGFPEGESTTFNVNNPSSSGFFSFFSYLILLSLLIPISLYVSVEFVKVFIMVQISADREMYVEEDDMPSRARTSGLCEELGQVSYIFSDKTGTLTQNMMEFKKCSIAGVEYGRGYCEVERAIARRKGLQLPADPDVPEGLDPGFNFVDERLLWGKWKTCPHADNIQMLLLNLAINHTVQVEYAGAQSTIPTYQAESPDEGAFVLAARNLGFSFKGRMMREMTICVAQGGGERQIGEGKDDTWTILNTNAFDNNRKRTSVVARDPKGQLHLLVKGADTSVMPFVDYNTCLFFDETQKHIDRFSDQGLRTLVFAGRQLSTEEYDLWNAKYKEASLMSEGREAALRQLASCLEESHEEADSPSALFDATVQYRKCLQLHGVTALEDKLQENVGDTIGQLAKAMIKIWVLTGDKLETAINIGYATALLGSEMEPLHRISQDELGTTSELPGDTPLEKSIMDALELVHARDMAGLQKHVATFGALEGAKPIFAPVIAAMNRANKSDVSDHKRAMDLSSCEGRLKESLLRERVKERLHVIDGVTSRTRKGGHALVIDGPCLRACMEESLRETFLNVGVRCKAVVCCRVTPSQKAQVTLLVKDNMPGQITLAIGDGANDVAMIHAAHIGVGIRGKEGQQAVLASDYALPRFCFLERLLLIHGRWGYNRIGTMICYFIYKNIAFALTLFWFSFFNGFSSQPLFDDGYQSCYNVFFTSLPVMFFAGLDRDLEPEVVRLKPELYSTGHFSERFNGVRFTRFIFGAIVHSLFFYFVTVTILDTNISDQNGTATGMWTSGTAALTCVIVTVNVTMGLHTRSWCWLHWLVYVGSIFMWFFFLMVYHAIKPGMWQFFDTALNVYFLFFQMANIMIYWLTVAVVVAMACMPVVCYKYYREYYYPGVDDYYRRLVSREGMDKIRAEAAGVGGSGRPASAIEVDGSAAANTSSSPYNNTTSGNYSNQSALSTASSGNRTPVAGGAYLTKLKNIVSRNKEVQHTKPTRSDFTPPPSRVEAPGSARFDDSGKLNLGRKSAPIAEV